MIPFGKTSMSRLLTCDERLQRLFLRVNEKFTCTIICGGRGKAEQDEAFRTGKSKLRYPAGKHNKTPSHAIDVMPDPVCWDETAKNIEQLTLFAGYVLGVASEMGINIRWGHDWDKDMKPDTKGLVDRPHYELV